MAEDKVYSGEWQLVDATGAQMISLFRQKVPGGWLVMCGMNETAASSFVPDADWSWDPPIKQGRKKGGGFY